MTWAGRKGGRSMGGGNVDVSRWRENCGGDVEAGRNVE